jgi:hypothetical protein
VLGKRYEERKERVAHCCRESLVVLVGQHEKRY